jgi:hypothetical protein
MVKFAAIESLKVLIKLRDNSADTRVSREDVNSPLVNFERNKNKDSQEVIFSVTYSLKENSSIRVLFSKV